MVGDNKNKKTKELSKNRGILKKTVGLLLLRPALNKSLTSTQWVEHNLGPNFQLSKSFRTKKIFDLKQ